MIVQDDDYFMNSNGITIMIDVNGKYELNEVVKQTKLHCEWQSLTYGKHSEKKRTFCARFCDWFDRFLNSFLSCQILLRGFVRLHKGSISTN